jgi:PAS domain S-box-containing protein
MAVKDEAAEIDRLLLENEQLLEARRLAEERSYRYADLFEHAPLPYVTLDGAGAIQSLNPAAMDVLAANGRHLEGKRLRSLVVEADAAALAEHLRNCPTTAEALSCEVHLRDFGLVKLVSQRIRPGLRLYPTLIVDVRDREKAAAENRRLVEAEKAARAAGIAKDQFIAVLSHELRTPLTPVLAAATALERKPEVPQSLRAICDIIRRNVLIEIQLIDDLLDVTRIAQGKMRTERRPVDVHAAAQNAVETLRFEIAAKRLSVEVALEARHSCAAADPLRLKQVFWNLIRNALKFTPEGGRIELRSWNNTVGETRRLFVEVRDTGRGFEGAIAPKLFEAFEQGRETRDRQGGLGLGLAISKGVMELHGGRITASSQGPGKGARFVIEIETIDEAPASLEPRPVPVPRLEPADERLRILLVDDHHETAEVLEEVLIDAGYEVRSAHTVHDALTADFDRVDLLISDIGLPDASGHDLMRSIRSHHQIKGLALSGYGTEADVRASYEAGFSLHLTKPVEVSTLLSAIRQVSVSSRL